MLYGVKFEGDWTLENMLTVLDAVSSVANRFAEVTRGRASDAFRAVYNTSTQNPLIFEMGCPECSKLGKTESSHRIKVKDFYQSFYTDKPLRDQNFIVHELGHAFNAQMVNHFGEPMSPYQVLNRKQTFDPEYPDRTSEKSQYFGFASRSGEFTWQQSDDPHYMEEFADQFLGWTFNEWALSIQGSKREDFMNAYMYSWISETGYR
jgi:hypothetical protein